MTESIVDAIVIKHTNVFFLSDPDGSVPLRKGHGLGLYYRDCRFLDGYRLSVVDQPLMSLASTADRDRALFVLTNPELLLPGGDKMPQGVLSVRWERHLNGKELLLRDRLIFEIHGNKAVSLPISLAFNANFQDVFVVRGQSGFQTGTQQELQWLAKDKELRFIYDGVDGLKRGLKVVFSEAPDSIHKSELKFKFKLEPRQAFSLEIVLKVGIAQNSKQLFDGTEEPAIIADIQACSNANRENQLSISSDEWLENWTKVESGSEILNRLLHRSARDLHTLRNKIGGSEYFCGGIPWFGTLFGRDTLISAFQTLAFNSETARETLHLVSRYQGTKRDHHSNEEPGKILHELRQGELANAGEIPYTPQYGTVDATPLFLILLAQHASWAGNLETFRELRSNVERALGWIDSNIEKDHLNYISYEGHANGMLVNQGWKDSGNAILNSDGQLGIPPIRLVEVQAYVYAAKLMIANLYEREGEVERARGLRAQARELRERFNQDFWIAEKNFFALALQANGKPVSVLSSNPGHALWCGIADFEKAKAMAVRLLSPEMFSGWGVRTLSSEEFPYNPVGYHLGTVWPHDNSIIAAGLRKYGFDQEAIRIFDGILEAATHFNVYRLPEAFAGIDRKSCDVPVRYPSACHPQAWAAGASPFLLQTLLGLEADAWNKRLIVRRPLLPSAANEITLRALKIGQALLDLRFWRDGDKVRVEILRNDDSIELVVEERLNL